MNKRPEWLADIYGHVRCVVCDHRFRAEEMHVDMDSGDAFIVHVHACAGCGANVGILVPKALVEWCVAKRVPDITKEEVLDVHDALATMDRLPKGVGN